MEAPSSRARENTSSNSGGYKSCAAKPGQLLSPVPMLGTKYPQRQCH